MKSIDGIMKTFPEMLMNFPLWKYVPPRWSSSFRKAEDHNNVASDFVKGKKKQSTVIQPWWLGGRAVV